MTPEELHEAVKVIVNKILNGDTSVNVGDVVKLINENISDTKYLVKEKIDWQSTYYWRVKPHGGDWIEEFTFSTGNPSYVFAASVDPVEIQVNSTMDSDGIIIYGMYNPFYSAAIDMNGNEVWNSGGVDTYMFSSVDHDYNFLGAAATFPPNFNGEFGIEFTIEEGITWSQPTYGDEVDFLQHELIKLPNGNYMGFVPVIEQHPIPTYTNYPEQTIPFDWEEDCSLYINYDANYYSFNAYAKCEFLFYH